MFIAEYADVWRVTTMCRVLEVSRAGYYSWRDRKQSQRAVRDAELTREIRQIHTESEAAYGSPRVHAKLRSRGMACARKRVARLMREDGLKAVIKRRYCVTTDSKHAGAIAPNLLQRRFAPEAVGEPDSVWVGDITYIRTYEGFVYLATVIDLYSRRVVGWSMSANRDAGFTVSAMRDAIASRRPAPGLIFHSDRGKQYASSAFLSLLREHGIEPSMSRKGNCYDNAVAESFFGSLKREVINRRRWPTRSAARAAVFTYIEGWYNRRRLHTTLGFRSPEEFEMAAQNQVA